MKVTVKADDMHMRATQRQTRTTVASGTKANPISLTRDELAAILRRAL